MVAPALDEKYSVEIFFEILKGGVNKVNPIYIRLGDRIPPF